MQIPVPCTHPSGQLAGTIIPIVFCCKCQWGFNLPFFNHEIMELKWDIVRVNRCSNLYITFSGNICYRNGSCVYNKRALQGMATCRF